LHQSQNIGSMKTDDIKQIWKSANTDETVGKQYSLKEIQEYRKKKSRQFSQSGKRIIYFDIGFKGLLVLALLYLITFQVAEPVYQQIIVVLISVTAILLGMNFIYLKKLEKIKETDAVMNNLKNQLHYFKNTYRNFIINSSFSNPIFVVTGFFFYFQFKYHEIRMGTPWEDPVLYLFLLAAFIISLGAQWANYRNELKELTEAIKDLDDESIASLKIEEHRMSRRRNLFMYTILIVLGMLVLLYFLL